MLNNNDKIDLERKLDEIDFSAFLAKSMAEDSDRAWEKCMAENANHGTGIGGMVIDASSAKSIASACDRVLAPLRIGDTTDHVYEER